MCRKEEWGGGGKGARNPKSCRKHWPKSTFLQDISFFPTLKAEFRGAVSIGLSPPHALDLPVLPILTPHAPLSFPL